MKIAKISLLDIVSKDLKLYDFKLIKTKEWFIKKNNEKSCIFWIVFYNDPDGIRVTPTVAVRLEQVEKIFHISSSFSKKNQRNTHTIVSELWRYLDSPKKYQYKIVTEDNIPSVAERLFNDFKHEALNYFQNYSELEQVDSLLNDNPHQYSVHQIMDFTRCSRGIITAKLCSRKNYQELSSIYRERMKNQNNGFYLASFEQLLEDLSNY